MKKILLALLLLAIPIGIQASVWQYGDYEERAQMAAECGIFGYRGTYLQNTSKEVLECFQRLTGKSDLLGFSVITRYRTTLSSSITSNTATIPVSSMTTFDGETITTAMLGSKIFLSIEPGSAREEIVMCTGISGTTWTGCTRGLAFSGTSTSAVSANQKSHNAGSVVVMSNVHYVYEELVDKDTNSTINGNLTIGGNLTATGTVTTYGFPIVSSTGYIGLPTLDGQLATKYYVDNVGAGGFTSANVSTTRGLSVDGSSPEKVGVNVSSTLGMAFDSSGALYQKVSSTQGLQTDSNGIGINYAYDNTWTGTNTFSGTTTLATTTLTSTTVSNLTITGTTTFSGAISGTFSTSSDLYVTTTPAAVGSELNGYKEFSFVCNFRPSIVKINYNLKGYSGSGVENTFSQGTATYNETTLKHNMYMTQNSDINAAGSYSAGDEGLTSSTPYVGDWTGVNESLVVTTTVYSITDTTATVRIGYRAGPSATAHEQRISIECYK